MSTFYSDRKTLEEFPDEILLFICQYLSSTDVLFSFYGLNSRLTQMISGYFQSVIIGQIPYNRFRYICESILPKIGSNIISLVVSNQWKGILSKFFLDYFNENMSLIFSHLRQLTLVSFNDNSLKVFLDSFEDLPGCHEIIIHQLYQMNTDSIVCEILLHRIFTANKNQFNSILFDVKSMIFSLENLQIFEIFYSNIQKLSINLNRITDLHRLLTLLPELISFNVTLSNNSIESAEIDEDIPIVTLKEFQLQSFGPSWNIARVASILKRLPNIEELSLSIDVDDDIRLMDGQILFSLLSFSILKKFNYYLRLYNSLISIDEETILSTWKQFKQEFICFKSDDQKTFVLYTLPFRFSSLILSNSIAKNKIFTENSTSQLTSLTLSIKPTDTVEAFSVIKKCHRLTNLKLRIFRNPISKFSEKSDFCKLFYLTKITVLRESIINTDCFQRLLEISPNLYHLEVNYEFLRSLFDNESVCLLLKQRITHIYILIPTPTNLELAISSIPRLANIFPSLKHFYFALKNVSQPSKTLILHVLAYLPFWNSLVSFGVVETNLTQDDFSENLSQWIRENSTLHEQRSFVSDHSDDAFRLWL